MHLKPQKKSGNASLRLPINHKPYDNTPIKTSKREKKSLHYCASAEGSQNSSDNIRNDL